MDTFTGRAEASGNIPGRHMSMGLSVSRPLMCIPITPWREWVAVWYSSAHVIASRFHVMALVQVTVTHGNGSLSYTFPVTFDFFFIADIRCSLSSETISSCSFSRAFLAFVSSYSLIHLQADRRPDRTCNVYQIQQVCGPERLVHIPTESCRSTYLSGPFSSPRPSACQ